jgi:uncharacterized protein
MVLFYFPLAENAACYLQSNFEQCNGMDHTPAKKYPKPRTRRIQVRSSGVHGKGVFALTALAAGATIIEYKGEIISWPQALERHPHDPAQPNHTFYFHIESGDVIDGNVRGNISRWINHACAPNCEADERGGRVFIKALRAIAAGEELFYNYGLSMDARYTAKLKKEFACCCGAPNCLGTMLVSKR